MPHWRFTMSEDGVPRCMIQVSMRLTRAQVAFLEQLAKETEESLEELLQPEVALAVEALLDREGFVEK